MEKPITYEIKPNDYLEAILEDAKRLSAAKDAVVEFEYDGINFLVVDYMDVQDLMQRYRDARLMGRCTIERYYDADTQIELMTRRLYEAKMTKRAGQKYAKSQIKHIPRRKEYELMRKEIIAASRNLLKVAEIDEVIKGYTRISCFITDDCPYYEIPMYHDKIKITVSTASDTRTFDVSYAHERRGFFIYLPVLGATSYNLTFSASGHVDVRMADVKIREGKLNKIKVQMELES